MMIDSSSVGTAGSAQSAGTGAVFKMISSDRMAGSVPAWVQPSSAQDVALTRLGRAAADGRTFSDVMSEVLSYQDEGAAPPKPIGDEPFGFGDLVDIVNPLQHLPVIGTLYRNLTGDQIRPSSAVLGGAVFGGIAGAAGSLVNVIIAEETGKDITEHVLALAMPEKPDPDAPLQKLAESDEPPQLPGAALSFVDLGHAPEPPASKSRQVWKFNE
ncbi:MAG TPA: hypothetical protein VIF12_05790 [Micavibrio sp.]|jgi:hypothetical protein